jgi:hypothetical protein
MRRSNVLSLPLQLVFPEFAKLFSILPWTYIKTTTSKCYQILKLLSKSLKFDGDKYTKVLTVGVNIFYQ